MRGVVRRGAVAAALSSALVAPAVGGTAAAAPDRGAVRFATYETKYRGGEPTVGVLKNGSLVLQAFTSVLRSGDGGRTWAEVKRVGDTTMDPYIHVDAVTGRILSSQLLVGCQLISMSDDGGETWTDLPTQCGTVDHQKLGSGPWRNPADKPYPRNVYTCMNHAADTACAISLDGGVTWGPPIPAFPGVDPTAPQGAGGVPGFCGGLLGDPVSAPDGTLYLPREYCGRPFLGVSTDDGLTWSRHHVSAPAQARPIAFGANNPSVAVAADGTVFYAWTGEDYAHYVARSRDRGRTWTKPWRLNPPGVGSTTFPVIVAGRSGAVATAFIATRGRSGIGPDAVDKDARWHLYVSITRNGNASRPTWSTQRVTRDPVMPGCIGRHGFAPCDNSSMLDFNDIALDRSGRVVVSYSDGCPRGCPSSTPPRQSVSAVAVQVSGPPLR